VIDRRPPRASRIEDATGAFLEGHGHEWFNTCTTSLLVAQRFNVFRHRSFDSAMEAGRIDTLLTQVVLKTSKAPRHRKISDGKSRESTRGDD
jgi:hypothetical protein